MLEPSNFFPSFEYNVDKQKEQRGVLMDVLQKQKFTDTTFLIGPKEEEYNVNRIFLAMISPVFEAMLFGKMKESSLDSDVIIKDMEPKHFECILNFAYCQDPRITAENVVALYQIADKYRIEILSKWCIEYFRSHLTNTNVCTLLNASIINNQTKLSEECMRFMSKQSYDVVKTLESVSFKEMGVKAMKYLLSSDYVEIEEERLWKHVVEWAEYQSKESIADDDEKHCGDKKALLMSVYKLMRFGLMDGDFFAKHVVSENVLTNDEALSVLVYIHNRDVGCAHFNTRKRCSEQLLTEFRLKMSSKLAGKDNVKNTEEALLSTNLFESCSTGKDMDKPSWFACHFSNKVQVKRLEIGAACVRNHSTRSVYGAKFLNNCELHTCISSYDGLKKEMDLPVFSEQEIKTVKLNAEIQWIGLMTKDVNRHLSVGCFRIFGNTLT